jgi:hypothetical protein
LDFPFIDSLFYKPQSYKKNHYQPTKNRYYLQLVDNELFIFREKVIFKKLPSLKKHHLYGIGGVISAFSMLIASPSAVFYYPIQVQFDLRFKTVTNKRAAINH